MRTVNRRLAMVMLSLLTASSAVLVSAPTASVAAPGDKRPNLQMVRLHDWHIQTVNGRRLLRFTTIFANAGPGRFELRGSRSSHTDNTMEIEQVMFRWAGGSRRIETGAVAKYSGDGHDHWHVQDVVTYEAWRLASPQDSRRGVKTGFCFFDTTPWKLSLPHARQSPYYQEEWCGTHESMANRVGVSVGWGDRYPWNFAFQWIDITGLPGGVYRVRATVDIQDYYRETDNFDNCVWTEVRVPAPGSGGSLHILDHGRNCGKAAVTAVTSFPGGDEWEPPRSATIEAGVHTAWQLNSQGTRLRKLWRDVAADRTATVSARGVPPGATGPWLYMTSGPFTGYWLKEGSGVQLDP